MRRMRLASFFALALALCAILLLNSCRRLNVGAHLEDLEWVVIACHTEGFWNQWVAKLTPETDAQLIAQLMGAINGAKWVRETSETGGDGFIVFKLRGGGIRTFNFVPWDLETEVEIRPGFSSRELHPLLEKIARQKIGWNKGDSLPQLTVKQVQVRQVGRPVEVFPPNSPSFARLLAAASPLLKAFDPRWCMPNYEEGNPVRASRYQKVPQFAFLLEKPIPMHKLIVWTEERGGVVSRVRYQAFSSSLIAIYQEHAGRDVVHGPYIAFVPDGAPNRSYNWSFPEGYFAARTMGKPDSAKAYEKLLQVYENIAATPR